MPLPPLTTRERRLNVADLMVLVGIASMPLAALAAAATAGGSVPLVLSLTLLALVIDAAIWTVSTTAPRRKWARGLAPFVIVALALGWFGCIVGLFFLVPVPSLLVAATALALRVYLVTWS